MFKQWRLWASRGDLEAARGEILRALEEAEHRIHATQSFLESSSRQRARTKAITAGVILLLSASGSVALVGAASSQLAPQSDPGRIGVAVIGEVNAEPPTEIRVRASFDASNTQGTGFMISVTDSRNDAHRPLKVMAYFCGAIGHGLHLKEINSTGELHLNRLEQSHLIGDSNLGLRQECRYVVASSGTGRQVLIAGNSTSGSRANTAASISFTFPGVRTTTRKETLGSEIVLPLEGRSRISVALEKLPADLRISSAQPQLPPRGTPHWESTVSSASTLPSQYRISGSLKHQETIVQSQLFIGGALAAIAGAAFLWLVELMIDRPRQRFTVGLASGERDSNEFGCSHERSPNSRHFSSDAT